MMEPVAEPSAGVTEIATDASAPKGDGGGESGTNNQVQGVDEADIASTSDDPIKASPCGDLNTSEPPRLGSAVALCRAR